MQPGKVCNYPLFWSNMTFFELRSAAVSFVCAAVVRKIFGQVGKHLFSFPFLFDFPAWFGPRKNRLPSLRSIHSPLTMFLAENAYVFDV